MLEHWFYLYVPWFLPFVLVAMVPEWPARIRCPAPVAATAPGAAARCRRGRGVSPRRVLPAALVGVAIVAWAIADTWDLYPHQHLTDLPVYEDAAERSLAETCPTATSRSSTRRSRPGS